MEQIIINYTDNGETKSLIVNAKIDGQNIVKVVVIETIEQKKFIEQLKKLVENGKL